MSGGGTVNESRGFDFALEVEGKLRRRVEFELGDGGAPIRVVTR